LFNCYNTAQGKKFKNSIEFYHFQLLQLFSLVFSTILFSHPYTSRHVIGIVLVFTALMLEALDSRKNHNEAKHKANGYAIVPPEPVEDKKI